ncbi:MAG: GNAT family N-acetyltransferase [Gemmatimonadales bacterium]
MPIVHHVDEGRFVLDLPEGEAVLEYVLDGGVMNILSTRVPQAARGRGTGGRLVETALTHAREQSWRIIPSCGYVRAWVAEHPEYRDLLAS